MWSSTDLDVSCVQSTFKSSVYSPSILRTLQHLTGSQVPTYYRNLAQAFLAAPNETAARRAQYMCQVQREGQPISVFPISFSIPEALFEQQVPAKMQNFSSVIPGMASTYRYSASDQPLMSLIAADAHVHAVHCVSIRLPESQAHNRIRHNPSTSCQVVQSKLCIHAFADSGQPQSIPLKRSWHQSMPTMQICREACLLSPIRKLAGTACGMGKLLQQARCRFSPTLQACRWGLWQHIPYR